MKYAFTFLLLLICLSTGYAQEQTTSYNEIVFAPGASKEELYNRADQWLKGLKYQISFNDSESGFISVGGERRIRQSGIRKLRKGRLIYVITLIIEEQKYWYDFAQYYYDVVPSTKKNIAQANWTAANPADPGNTELYKEIDAKVRLQIEDLKRSMAATDRKETPADSGLMGNK